MEHAAEKLIKKFQTVEELCDLLLGVKDAPATVRLNSITESIHDLTGVTAFDFSDEKKTSSLPILTQLLHLLRECMLKHAWPQALQILLGVVKIPEGTSQTIWKVGTELLGIEEEENRYLIRQLYSQMKEATDLNCHDVVIDFMSYLLSIGDNKEALRVMQELKRRHGLSRKKREGEEHIEVLCTAYLGLLWYIEWKRCQEDLDTSIKDEQTPGKSFVRMSQQQSMSAKMTQYRDKAITCFKKLSGVPGVWDIFITKHAELLVDSDDIKDAVKMLTEYRDCNQDNLNAHKYLYLFCKEHYPKKKDLTQQLKQIAEMSPSDELVLLLCEEIREEDAPTAVGYLFKLLDYSCWQHNNQPWSMLAQCLQYLHQNRSNKGAWQSVQECWDIRSSWWPAYHFSTYVATSETGDQDLLKSKATVASLLCGKDCEFVETVKRLKS